MDKITEDTWDLLDEIDTVLGDPDVYTHTLEISEDVVKEVKEKSRAKRDKKPGFLNRAFSKKKKLDFSELDNFDAEESHVEELNFTQELVSELSDTMELSNDLLDKALKEVNQSSEIQEILAQPTEDVQHYLDRIDPDGFEEVEVDDSTLEDVTYTTLEDSELEVPKFQPDFEMELETEQEAEDFAEGLVEELRQETEPLDVIGLNAQAQDDITEISQELEIVEVEEETNFELAKKYNVKTIFSDVSVYVNDQSTKTVDLNQVILPDIQLAHKFNEVVGPTIENGTRAEIKYQAFTFSLKEIAKVMRYSKKKVEQNNVEIEFLKQQNQIKDEKIKTLQDKLGNPFEEFME